MTLLFRLDKGLRALAISQFLKDLSGSMMSVLNYFRMGPISRGRYSHLHAPLDIALLIIYPKKYRAMGITLPVVARPDALDAAARLDLQAVRLADHRGLPGEHGLPDRQPRRPQARLRARSAERLNIRLLSAKRAAKGAPENPELCGRGNLVRGDWPRWRPRRLPRLGDGLYRLVAGLSMVERDHSCQNRSRVTRGHVLTTGLANRGRRPARLVAGGGPLHRRLPGFHLDHGPLPSRAPCLRKRANARMCERLNVLAGELAGERACAKLCNSFNAPPRGARGSRRWPT